MGFVICVFNDSNLSFTLRRREYMPCVKYGLHEGIEKQKYFSRFLVCWESILAINSLAAGGVICGHETWSTLDQVMAWCLTAPSHCLNQCWLIFSEILWHSSKDDFTKVCLWITHLALPEHLLGANELTQWGLWTFGQDSIFWRFEWSVLISKSIMEIETMHSQNYRYDLHWHNKSLLEMYVLKHI